MDSEKDLLEEELKGYKEKIMPVNKAILTWDRELIFTGRTQRGYEIEFDAHQQWGCSPTEALLLSVASCMAIDVVTFLQKMKGEIKSFRIDITGERNPTPPQYYKRIEMTLHISAKNVTEKQIARAVSLSHEKYCSVYHSLRKDIEVKVDYILTPE
ncbi:MAG: OsmC family protein [Thermodesulfovibrionales bacterium]|nr:OsmC family protein [Thermodesulfovibrionales bacterium]